MTTIRQLWRHTRTGEVYAVKLDGAHVTGACGPLDYLEQRADMLETMPYDFELGAEIDSSQNLYVLTRQPPEQRTVMRWGWKSLQRWLYHHRPDIGIGQVEGVKGFYKISEGLDGSFVPCGYTWRDVAKRVGAIPYGDK